MASAQARLAEIRTRFVGELVPRRSACPLLELLTQHFLALSSASARLLAHKPQVDSALNTASQFCHQPKEARAKWLIYQQTRQLWELLQDYFSEAHHELFEFIRGDVYQGLGSHSETAPLRFGNYPENHPWRMFLHNLECTIDLVELGFDIIDTFHHTRKNWRTLETRIETQIDQLPSAPELEERFQTALERIRICNHHERRQAIT